MKLLNDYRMRMMLIGIAAGMIVSGGNLKADFTFGEPVNLGPTINSSINDGGPTISTDGLSLLFDRWTNSLGTYETFLATRPTRQDSWDTPVSVGLTISSDRSHPADLFKSIKFMPGVTTSDGLELYFMDIGPDAYGAGDLYMTQRQTIDDDWGDPMNLGPVVNSSADEICPTISPDGLELYFSGYTSNACPGGYGSGDLWVTKRPTRNDPWCEPVNLGPTVNTAYQDARPRISADGLVLFFDSRRPGGSGSADLYMMRRATLFDTWGEPINLGPIINSSAFDEIVFPSADGSSLFFDSNRSGGYGGQDIYQAPIIPIIDLNGDGIVDATDMCIVVDHWGENYSLCDVGPTPLGDGIVDIEDLVVLSEHLFEEVDDPTLVAHWPLDEAEGMVVADIAGDNNGYLLGDADWQPDNGAVGGALQLDGIADYVSTGLFLYHVVDKFSVVAWIKGGRLARSFYRKWARRIGSARIHPKGA